MPAHRGAPSHDDPREAVALRRRRIVTAGHRGEAAAIHPHLNDPEPTIREAALGALARAGALDREALRSALEDPDQSVRLRAIELGAAHPREPGATTAPVDLRPLLRDPDHRVAEAAAWALGEQQPPALDAVEQLASMARQHPDNLCREAAVASLGSLGDPAGLPAILAATGDVAPVRRRAVIALAAFEGPEVEDSLERSLGDRDWQVRQAAEDLRRRPGP